VFDLLHPSPRHFAFIAAGTATAMLTMPHLIDPAAAQATPGGTGDVFQMLIRDHQQITQTLQQIKQAEQPEAKMQGVKTLDRMLVVHDLAEGLVVYPALRKTDNLQDVASNLYKEHADIKTHMFTLQTVLPTENLWSDTLSELEQLILAHAKQEEEEAFPEYQQAVKPEVIQALTTMAQQKRAMVSG
jgi:hemerythrin superfamily protein